MIYTTRERYSETKCRHYSSNSGKLRHYKLFILPGEDTEIQSAGITHQILVSKDIILIHITREGYREAKQRYY